MEMCKIVLSDECLTPPLAPPHRSTGIKIG
jgi:hypothetical protein